MADIITEQRGREAPIHFKQIGRQRIEEVLKEIERTEADLEKKGANNIAHVYTIVTKEHSYSGKDRTLFLQHFDDAKNVESLDLALGADLDEERNVYNKRVSFHVEVCTDSDANKQNRLQVFGIDDVWVENTFARINGKISKYKSNYRFLYSSPFLMLVQMSAVFAIIALSIRSSLEFQGAVNLPSSHVYIFIAAFLLCSNIWTFGLRWLQSIRGGLFPSVGFQSVTVFRIVWQLISGLFFPAILAWAINYLLNFIVTPK